MNNKLSVFYEHIFEAAQQSGKSVEECLRFAKSCGIDFLECDLWRLDEREEVKSLLDRCGMGVSCLTPRGISAPRKSCASRGITTRATAPHSSCALPKGCPICAARHSAIT